MNENSPIWARLAAIKSAARWEWRRINHDPECRQQALWDVWQKGDGSLFVCDGDRIRFRDHTSVRWEVRFPFAARTETTQAVAQKIDERIQLPIGNRLAVPLAPDRRRVRRLSSPMCDEVVESLKPGSYCSPFLDEDLIARPHGVQV